MPPKKTLHGIDMSAPDAIAQLLAFHRATFGDAVMLADDDNEDDEQEEQDDSGADDSGDEDEGDNDPDGSEDLGDKGKKALDAMKARLKAAKTAEKEAKAETARLRAEKEASGKAPEEQSLDAARREATEQALSAANKKILRSEVKAAAAGKLANPALAVKLIDLDSLEVDEDGNVDEEALAEAISDLLQENPFLAAQGGTTKFDSARGKPRQKGQLTREDLKKLTPEQIAKAYDEGRVKG